MRFFLGVIAASASVLLFSTSTSALADGTQTRLGDALSLAIPLATFGTEWFRGDREGAVQYAEMLAVSVAATEVLKHTVHAERPDHGDNHSFPSLHATSAFSAASDVNRRYGFEQSLPLYALATYVGYTRVRADEHRWGDVVGSALLTTAASWWLVTPYADQRLTLVPVIDRKYVGVNVAVRF